MYQPDPTDWKIIKLLNQDGRMSSAEISRRLGDVSARTVTNRIEVLTKHGIIKIRSVVNPERVGYGVLADVFIEVEVGTLRSVANHLAGLPQISYVVCATGDTDIIISVRAPSIEELYDFVKNEIFNSDITSYKEYLNSNLSNLKKQNQTFKFSTFKRLNYDLVRYLYYRNIELMIYKFSTKRISI